VAGGGLQCRRGVVDRPRSAGLP